MSIASQLTALEGNISDAYNMVAQRGGTVPARKNMENLDDAIATIPSGGSFVGIPRKVVSTAYGPYMEVPGIFSFPSDAELIKRYAFAYAFYYAPTDNGPTGVDGSNLIATNEGALLSAFERCRDLITVDFSSLTTAGEDSFKVAFKECSHLTTANFSSLKTVQSGAFNGAFNDAISLSSVNFSAVETVQTNAFNAAFRSCRSLTTIDMSSVTTTAQSAFENAFYGCTSLTSADFSGLQSVNGSYALRYMFYGCTSLTTMTFTNLSSITASSALSNCFRGCTSLASVSFPALTTASFGTRTDQFSNMLYGCTGVTVHFPAAVQSTIGSWADVTNGFGGTNTTVLFDL